MALSVPLSRFTSQVGGGSAFFVRPLRAFMKFRISLVANVVLVVAVIALSCQIASITVGEYYYHKMVGGLAAGAASELEKEHADLVRQALAAIPADPDTLALIEASKKVGVMK